MESVFVQGIAGFIASILVFVGSIFLLLALVMGARLAYYVTAAVTLGFTLIMGVVWSVGTPLGPVGVLPEWTSVGAAGDPAGIDLGPASQYPEGGWAVPDDEDAAQTTKTAELESASADVFAEAIESGDIQGFAGSLQGELDKDLTRLIEVGDREYGAVTYVPSAPALDALRQSRRDADTDTQPELRGDVEDAPAVQYVDPDARAVIMMEYDPGNPLGKARMITAGTAILFAGHLVGLSMSERKARRRDEEEGA